MTGREYLRSYREAILELARLEDKSRALFERATSITSPMTGMPRSSSHDQHAVMDALAAATEQEGQKLHDALQRKVEIEKFVDLVPGDLNRQILRLRYIELDSWPIIQTKLGDSGVLYETRGLFKRHKAAIAAADKLYKEMYGGQDEE